MTLCGGQDMRNFVQNNRPALFLLFDDLSPAQVAVYYLFKLAVWSVYMCVCVYMHTCMSACMCVCVYVCACLHVCVCVCVCMQRVCVCVHAACVCVCACVHACVCVCVRVCI